MADVSVMSVSGGKISALKISEIVESAAAGTIPCNSGKDNRMAVLVINADDEAVKFTVKAPASGGGVRSSLGDLEVSVDAGDQTLIPLFDTARFKVLSGTDSDKILFTLTDALDEALAAGELANVTIVAMQL